MTTTTTAPQQSYTQWVTDPIKAKISEVASEYAARPVAPGADREQIIELGKPWVAIASVAIAATAARIAMHQTGADAEIAIATAVAAFAVAVVLGIQAKRRLLCVKRRTRVYAFLAAAAGWTVAALIAGVTGPMMFTLAIAGIGSSLWHWADHRLGYGWNAPKEEAVYARTPEVDVYAPLWEQNLAAPGRVLSGTRLTNWEHLKFGARYVLEVVPGTHTLEEIEAYESKIKSGLRLKRSHQMTIEEHPTLEAPTLMLTILDTTPVADGTPWPGISAMNNDGTIQIGPYLDGEGAARWRLYGTNRIYNGFIAGGTGSGKSRLLENIAMTAASSEKFPTAVWFADGQDGASSPMLMKHADWYAGKPEQILEMLQDAVELAKMQAAENVANGVQGFTPTAARPGLLVILDECRTVLDRKSNPEHWEEMHEAVWYLAAKGNKSGVGIILAGQEATLDSFGREGKAGAIRNNLQTENGVLLRTKQSVSSSIFTIPSAIIKSIRKGGGYGYVAGSEEAGGRRSSFRGFYDEDETVDRNMSSLLWRTVSPVSAVDLTKAYRDRKSNAEADVEAIRRQVAARRARAEAVQRGEQIPPVAVPEHMAAAKSKGGTAFTSFSLKSEFLGKKKNGPQLSSGQQRVLKAVQDGHSVWTEIGEASGLGRNSVFHYLNKLQEQKLVEKQARGRWTAAA